MSKQDIPQRILFAVCGMSPQIITETLYGLIHRDKAPWIPNEIHVITTLGGREQVRLQLLGEHGHFAKFLSDFDIRVPIKFDLSTVHTISNALGQLLMDLRTPDDNEAAADFITEKIREVTNNDNSELHVSLAGGRKSMGFYAGYALSLFGRARDRLSHVLVSAEYESLSEFYYPTPKSHTISTKSDSNKKLDAALAEVFLAEIPFVRLRGFLPDGALINKARFSELVALVEELTKFPKLTVIPQKKQLLVGEIPIHLSPREMALYTVFVKAAKAGKSVISVPKKGSVRLSREFLTELHAIKGELANTELTTASLSHGMERDYFDQIKSRLNKSLEKALGVQGSQPYKVKNRGRGSAEFWMDIPANRIVVMGNKR